MHAIDEYDACFIGILKIYCTLESMEFNSVNWTRNINYYKFLISVFILTCKKKYFIGYYIDSNDKIN